MKSTMDQRYSCNSQYLNVINKPSHEACCDRRQKSTIGLRLRASQEAPGMAKQTKSGYLLRYKKRIFGKDWREDYVVLYSDGTLTWYRDRERLEPDGGLYIKQAPHMMAVGQWTSLIPYRPPLPHGCQLSCLMAFGTKKKDKVHWFLCKDDDEVSGWMKAITKTLPPPPKPLNAHNQSSARDFVSKLASSPSIAINAARTPLSLPPQYLYGSYLNGCKILYHRSHSALPPRPLSMLHIPQLATPRRALEHQCCQRSPITATSTTTNNKWGWGYHWGPELGPGFGWGCGWGWGGYDRGFHYSDTDIRFSSSGSASSGKVSKVSRKERDEFEGYADSSTAMQLAYHSDFVSSDLMDDQDFVADSDSFDVGGFDCIF